MSVRDLLLQYQNSPRLFQLADRLSFAQPEKIYLKNLQGSSSQFVVASAFLHPSLSQQNHLIILNDAEEAAYFHNTLENLTDALDLFYFPSSFKNRKNYQFAQFIACHAADGSADQDRYGQHFDSAKYKQESDRNLSGSFI